MVTTFAVVAGTLGAHLSTAIVLVIGFSSLIADGISMAGGNYLGTKSEHELYRKEERAEYEEVATVPDKEREEIRDELEKKGYQGNDLDTLVRLVSSNKKFWVDFMMHEELGLFAPDTLNPFRHGLATFCAFVVAGSLPLLPYLVLPGQGSFLAAAIFSAAALFTVGAIRTYFSGRSWWKSGLEMLLVGGSSGAVAYGIGFVLHLLVV